MTTLVVIKHLQVGNLQLCHGEEVPPGLLPRELVDQWLDNGQLREYQSVERRSIYRLLPSFSGVTEREPLARSELTAFGLLE
jgi:hypothetical protein